MSGQPKRILIVEEETGEKISMKNIRQMTGGDGIYVRPKVHPLVRCPGYSDVSVMIPKK